MTQQLLRYTGSGYLLLIMLIRMMSMQVSLLDYAWNKTFIAQHLCENRLAPQMHCEGKCYLKKQLKHTAEAPASTDEKETGRAPVLDYCNEIVSFHSRVPVRSAFFLLPLTEGETNSKFSADIFHPPLA